MAGFVIPYAYIYWTPHQRKWDLIVTRIDLLRQKLGKAKLSKPGRDAEEIYHLVVMKVVAFINSSLFNNCRKEWQMVYS